MPPSASSLEHLDAVLGLVAVRVERPSLAASERDAIRFEHLGRAVKVEVMAISGRVA